jgi:hypothetical protein
MLLFVSIAMKEAQIDLAWSWFDASIGPCKTVRYAVDLRFMTLLFMDLSSLESFPLSCLVHNSIVCLVTTKKDANRSHLVLV